MSKFKVGDLVEISKDAKTWWSTPRMDYLRGSIQVVKDFDKYAVYVGHDGVHQYKTWKISVYEVQLAYNKGEKIMARRTFKLIKDLPDVKKGGLFQEECEDGTQPYTLITPENYRGDDGDYKCSYDDRKLVEKAPQWFVEVFKVTPEYMTREELDRWEVFKKGVGRVTFKDLPKKSQSEVLKVAGYWTPERRKAQSRRMKKIRAARKGDWGSSWGNR